ncbi:MAG: hypothetical protein WBC80_15200, partial [Isosphaeraceae bacterium]
MKPVQTLRKAFDRINAFGAEAARPKVRRAPACEMLEGRQLLNAAWTPPQGFAGWDGAAGKGADPAAHVHRLDAKGAGHDFAFPDGPVNPGVNPGGPLSLAFPGAPGGVAPSGVAGKTFKVTPQLQTDFQTLQTDQKTLVSQIPTSVTAAVKTDQATIRKALSSLTPTQLQAMHPGGAPSGTTSGTTSSNPTANMTATLTAAGISSS